MFKFGKDQKLIQRMLYDMFYTKVYKTAYFITKDPHLSQDILQETFIKAFNYYDTLQDKAKIESWMMSIATRTAIDVLRKKNKFNFSPLEEDLIDEFSMKNKVRESKVETEVEKRFLKKYIWEQIYTLPPEYRVVIVLKYIHGMKETEIADTLNIKLGTVKSRVHRAKSKMREAMERAEIRESIEGEIL
ncbi:RNA polymerase sigma-70 factor (ECF subfamily) [Caldalkalibacillus uzonensis]|uniref:RNA polymerase sigma-70 factor (ECF subfamily) n=1 Tax=Caldalkalibacillus uzonensis TaxID=353224 RepID=A0ABU0CVQ8_9BACI|nr:RNA polymerase sigma factor [Caldalkalibacillus uzonensis]MDQ0340510.1 RNA polymerase sigma-70 factor (ECF subfamily) [Caldalkalibacillus uzonensis]